MIRCSHDSGGAIGMCTRPATHQNPEDWVPIWCADHAPAWATTVEVVEVRWLRCRCCRRVWQHIGYMHMRERCPWCSGEGGR